MNDIPQSALNVLAGLNGRGENRLEEAEREAGEAAANGDRGPLDSLLEVRRQIEEGNVTCGCYCGTWDGLHRRCHCGNRRVCWAWAKPSVASEGYWHPEAY